MTASRRHQVTDIEPPLEPKVTQYAAQAKQCPCCGEVTEGELPAHIRARASYGPEACAQAANLTCGHYIPVHRATVLMYRVYRPPRRVQRRRQHIWQAGSHSRTLSA